MLALNAQPVMEARLKGFKPAGMTLISLVGHVAVQNHVVRAIPGTKYDWRWVRGLEIGVYVDDTQNWVNTLKAIALCRPAYLGLWNSVGHWGATVYLIPTAEDVVRPVREWKYELDFQAWMDFQNDDFMVGRTYERNAGGIPYAVNP